MPIAPHQVILLAAGMGTRLGDLGGGLPKAMFDAAGAKLIDRAVGFAGRLGADERIVVGGYRFELVSAHLAAAPKPNLRVVENPNYRAGNLFTLEVALPQITGSFLLMNIDHVYPAAVAQRILEQAGDEITAFVDFDRALTDDDMKVELDERRHIAKISKKLPRWDCGYVGMTYVPAQRLARYRQAVAEVRATVGDAANVEQVLQLLADHGDAVAIGDISGIGWHELDTPEDVARALPALRDLPV
jgi:L-glutamine-phosphate cytidylyltransferase